MSQKSTMTVKSLSDVVRETGAYPEDAFHFVRDGVEFAAKSIHGPMTPPQFVVARYMSECSIDLEAVMEKFDEGDLDPSVAAAIRQAGGADKLNRNVSGTDLCWALRDFAIHKWGNLADLVLSRWGITGTMDFGRIVFALVDNGFMQKEPHDSIDDFESVFEFSRVFHQEIGCTELDQ